MSKTFDYKIIKISEIKTKRNIRLLGRPYQYYTQNSQNRWLIKTIANNKTFFLNVGRTYGDFKNFVLASGIGNENKIYNTDFTVESGKLISSSWDGNLNGPEKTEEIIEFINTHTDEHLHLMDENDFSSNFVDESWLDESAVYGSICTICSYDNPYTPHDPGYVCYKCKVGY